jgi:hypothetical protein
MRRTIVCLILFLFLLCVMPPLSGASESETTELMETDGSPYQSAPSPPPTAEAMAMDLLIVRPVSFIGLVIGTGLSLVATPFALASGKTGQVYERLVVQPYDFTVCRPLGQF